MSFGFNIIHVDWVNIHVYHTHNYIHVHVYMLMKDAKGRKKEASKAIQITK